MFQRMIWGCHGQTLFSKHERTRGYFLCHPTSLGLEIFRSFERGSKSAPLIEGSTPTNLTTLRSRDGGECGHVQHEVKLSQTGSNSRREHLPQRYMHALVPKWPTGSGLRVAVLEIRWRKPSWVRTPVNAVCALFLFAARNEKHRRCLWDENRRKGGQ